MSVKFFAGYYRGMKSSGTERKKKSSIHTTADFVGNMECFFPTILTIEVAGNDLYNCKIKISIWQKLNSLGDERRIIKSKIYF